MWERTWGLETCVTDRTAKRREFLESSIRSTEATLIELRAQLGTLIREGGKSV